MPDTTITLDRAILLTLARAGGPDTGLTVNHLWRRLTNACGAGPSWRMVANTVTRLHRGGYIETLVDEQIGEDCHPLFSLTAAGRALALQSQQLRPQGLKEFLDGERA
ncbi:hypothetical protein [Halomonas organivorans]|uniref:MarR family transcriptional regulator n=1 Tax=Halomonas organivorans TaxID=257772 RepID=A0A7W5C1C2_9GAMM|nr:hypothetical protein [Halomonas organivorans]MBB3142801.1 hypothetical protein [Halomonas organivorans]